MTDTARSEPISPWAAMALALVPCAALLGGRAALAIKRPASAKGAVVATTDAPLVVAPRPTLTQAQAELHATMREIARREVGSSPVVSRRHETDETEQASPMRAARPAEVAAPAVALTAVMRSGESPVAIIDGKVRRVGDEVAPRWVVGEIDVRECEVALVGPEGRRHVLSLRQR